MALDPSASHCYGQLPQPSSSVPISAQRCTSTPAVLAEVTARGCRGVRSSEAPVLCLDTSGQTALSSAAVAADITCRGRSPLAPASMISRIRPQLELRL